MRKMEWKLEKRVATINLWSKILRDDRLMLTVRKMSPSNIIRKRHAYLKVKTMWASNVKPNMLKLITTVKRKLRS